MSESCAEPSGLVVEVVVEVVVVAVVVVVVLVLVVVVAELRSLLMLNPSKEVKSPGGGFEAEERGFP